MGEENNENGFLQPFVARALLGEADTTLVGNTEYQKALPEILELYRQAWRWHGTGRYHYHGNSVKDVLTEIIEKDGLVPHKDPLD